jgi:hypothetical protein
VSGFSSTLLVPLYFTCRILFSFIVSLTYFVLSYRVFGLFCPVVSCLVSSCLWPGLSCLILFSFIVSLTYYVLSYPVQFHRVFALLCCAISCWVLPCPLF